MLAALRYLALNPVKTRLAAAPADWPWSTPVHISGAKTMVWWLFERYLSASSLSRSAWPRKTDPERVAALARASGTGVWHGVRPSAGPWRASTR